MNTIILQKTYILYCELSNLSVNFPKKDRYSIGLKIENTYLNLLEHIIAAEQTAPALKDRELLQASIKTEISKIMLRICLEKKLIKETTYFALSAQLIEIGKMIGGWKKSLRK